MFTITRLANTAVDGFKQVKTALAEVSEEIAHSAQQHAEEEERRATALEEAELYKKMVLDLQFEQLNVTREFQKLVIEKERELAEWKSKWHEATGQPLPEETAKKRSSTVAVPEEEEGEDGASLTEEKARRLRERNRELQETLEAWEVRLRELISIKTELSAHKVHQENKMAEFEREREELTVQLKSKEHQIQALLAERNQDDKEKTEAEALDQLVAEYNKLAADSSAQAELDAAQLKRLRLENESLVLKVKTQEENLLRLLEQEQDITKERRGVSKVDSAQLSYVEEQLAKAKAELMELKLTRRASQGGGGPTQTAAEPVKERNAEDDDQDSEKQRLKARVVELEAELTKRASTSGGAMEAEVHSLREDAERRIAALKTEYEAKISALTSESNSSSASLVEELEKVKRTLEADKAKAEGEQNELKRQLDQLREDHRNELVLLKKEHETALLSVSKDSQGAVQQVLNQAKEQAEREQKAALQETERLKDAEKQKTLEEKEKEKDEEKQRALDELKSRLTEQLNGEWEGKAHTLVENALTTAAAEAQQRLTELLEEAKKEAEVRLQQAQEQLTNELDKRAKDEKEEALEQLRKQLVEERTFAEEQLKKKAEEEVTAERERAEDAMKRVRDEGAEALRVAVQKERDALQAKIKEAEKEVEKAKEEKRAKEREFEESRKKAVEDAIKVAEEEKRVALAAADKSWGQKLARMEAERDEFRILYSKEASLRREIHNKLLELQGNIRVICRVRPKLPVDGKTGDDAIITEFPSEAEVTIKSDDMTRNKFEFERVFDWDSSQEQVFHQVHPFIISVMDGYNVCIFAYGQTGSGKTFTITGPPENPGVNSRAIASLFSLMEERAEDWTYSLLLSVMEIYNESLRDLLAPTPKRGENRKQLDIRQGKEGIMVPDLTEVAVTTIEQVMLLLSQANDARAVGSHDMNEYSSRSHMILCIRVEGKNKRDDTTVRGKLYLIDLAGSERVSKTDATGDRLKEAQNINRSLSALGDVIQALGAAKKGHVPFRNSKLTFLLQDSMGGNSKVLMFVNISPCMYNLSETLCSLNFAARCRSVELGQAKRQIEGGSRTLLLFKKKNLHRQKDG